MTPNHRLYIFHYFSLTEITSCRASCGDFVTVTYSAMPEALVDED
jgi:hypothetical protein